MEIIGDVASRVRDLGDGDAEEGADFLPAEAVFEADYEQPLRRSYLDGFFVTTRHDRSATFLCGNTGLPRGVGGRREGSSLLIVTMAASIHPESLARPNSQQKKKKKKKRERERQVNLLLMVKVQNRLISPFVVKCLASPQHKLHSPEHVHHAVGKRIHIG